MRAGPDSIGSVSGRTAAACLVEVGSRAPSVDPPLVVDSATRPAFSGRVPFNAQGPTEPGCATVTESFRGDADVSR